MNNLKNISGLEVIEDDAAEKYSGGVTTVTYRESTAPPELLASHDAIIREAARVTEPFGGLLAFQLGPFNF